MESTKININKLRTDLWTCHMLAEQRCLLKSCEWASDMLMVLPEEGEEKILAKLDKELYHETKFDPHYEHARSCFKIHEYDRAANLVRKHLDDDKTRFLHYFSMYKAAEKKRIDLMNEVTLNLPAKAHSKYNELRDSIERNMRNRDPDGWLLYVYGLILGKFRLRDQALKILEKSINLTPINWSAWFYLSTIINDKAQLDKLDLPNHLFRTFFYYKMRADLEIDPKQPWSIVSARETKQVIDKYFKNTTFIRTLNAKMCAYTMDDTEGAFKLYSEIRRDDPFGTSTMDTYSNLLYVKKKKPELAKLACDIERIDPFTAEANNCIANSYSARDQHSKAILYFTRALRIDPDNLHSWSLIGHEYLAVKNYDKAHQAYLNAISTNKRDIRAWLGLGKTFETIMSNPTHPAPNYERCLYYYSQVGRFGGKQDVMYKNLGNIFQRMEKTDHAINCYKRAGSTCWLKLAKLYESKGMHKEMEEIQAQINSNDGNADVEMEDAAD